MHFFYRHGHISSSAALTHCVEINAIIIIIFIIGKSNWTEWSTIQGVIAQVISKSDKREAQG